MYQNELETLLNNRNLIDYFILDQQNSITVNINPSNQNYIICHERLKNGCFSVIKKWELKTYLYGYSDKDNVFKEYNLFAVRGKKGQIKGLYNYEKEAFAVPIGLWENISQHNFITWKNEQLPKVNFLDKYGCFLASFTLSTKVLPNEKIIYNNCYTKELITIDFNVTETYYALLNPNGTIRSNQILKGNSLSTITDIINLDNYESLIDFKATRKRELEKLKQQKKEQYQQLIATRSYDNVSPYQDQEVLKILRLRKSPSPNHN